MAKNPCVYTLNGKTYSESEFKAHILEGNLDKVLDSYFKESKSPSGEQAREPRQKSLLNRAVSEDNSEQVNAAVEKYGLTYEPESWSKAESNADSFIKDVGIVDALDAVRKGKVKGASAAFVWGKAIDSVGAEIDAATDPAEIERLTNYQAELLNEFDVEAREGGRFTSALQDVYAKSNYSYNVARQIEKYKSLNNGEISPEVEAKFKDLGEQLKDVQKRLNEAEKKLADKVDEAAAEVPLKGKYADKAKKVADQVRKLKTKPFVFKDRDGNEIKLTKMSLVDWNDIVESAAVAIEKAGNVADGVSIVLERIKDTDWYKNLAEGDKDRFAQELTDYFNGKEEVRTERAKVRTEKRIGELQSKLDKGDLTKVKRKPIIEDTELTKLRAEKLRLQEQFDKEMYKAELKNRTTAQKAKDAVWDAWNLLRLVKATGEFSFVGVQGLIQTIAHPLNAIKAMKQALTNFSSEAKTEQFLNNIKAQEYYPLLVNSKLAITKPDVKLTAREELFYSGYTDLFWNMLGTPLKAVSQGKYDAWVKKNPFKAFERASVGYLDTMRIERFLDGVQMLETKGKTFKDSPKDYKDVADAINTLTGRGSLGTRDSWHGLNGEAVADGLTKIFFSPRNWSSVVKTATPYGFYHFGKMTPTARKMAAADFMKYVGLTTSIVAMAAASLNNDDDPETEVNLDPTNTDFGKIKMGNRVVDPWGGRIQQVILCARLWEESINKGGKDKQLGQGFTPTREELLINQALNKLNPSMAVVHKYLSSHVNKQGERMTAYGKPFSWSEELKPTPITYETIHELLKDDPKAMDGLLSFYAFMGGGVDVREEKK